MHPRLFAEIGEFSVFWPISSLVCAVVTQSLSSQDRELPSEVLCWIILPLLFLGSKGTTWMHINDDNQAICNESLKPLTTAKARGLTLTAVAVGVGITALATSELKSQAFLPALPPLVLLAQRRFHTDSHSGRLRDRSTQLVDSPLFAFVIAIFCSITLSKGDLLVSLTSLPALLGLLAVYVTLTVWASPRVSTQPTGTVENAVLPLSIRAAVISAGLMVIRCSFLGSGWPGLGHVSALGLAKACFWYSLILTSRNSSWMVGPVVKTFSIMATVDFMSLTSEYEAWSYILGATFSLSQLIGLLPQHIKSRNKLRLLVLVPAVPYLFSLWNVSALYAGAQNWDSSEAHPLDKLIEVAQHAFHQMRKRQSITYGIAHEEYRRRYGIDPPPGFQAWFEYAVSHQSPIIDEYDTLFKSISPYLQLSGKQVKELMQNIHDRPLNELWRCAFRGREPEAYCKHKTRSPSKDRDITLLFNQLLGDVSSQLRDIEVSVNHLDEPRVVFPPRSTPDGTFSLRNIKREPTWADVTAHCPSNMEQDWNGKHPLVKQYGLPFVANRTSTMDLCQHPEYEHMHGLLISPKNLRLIEGHVPILGTGSFSTMGDILIPSPAYIQATYQYDDHGDVPWEEKRNNLYWDGSNTGGYAKAGDKWLHFHRQRFVSFAQRLEDQSYYYLQSVGGKVVKTASKLLSGRLYDVAFTRILQCEPSACREQRSFFRRRTYTPATAALRSRLVFDVDGNGISGRFYRLLASHSLPLKQTLLREWHDERLFPWVHYVPISQSMEELPEVVRWLTWTERGQMRAREIAEAGRRWYYEAVRDVDKGIYLYRLMLEMARIQDEQRAAGQS